MSDVPMSRDRVAFPAIAVARREVARPPLDAAGHASSTIANAPTSGSSDLRVRIATSLADVERLGPDWAALDAQMTTPLFFQSFGWCRFLVQFHGSITTRPFAPRIISLWDGPHLKAIWPLQLRRSRWHALLVDLGDPVNQYGGALIATDVDAAAIATQLVAEARTILTADGLLLRKAHVGQPLANVLAATGFSTGDRDGAPFITLKGYASFEAFYKTILSRARRNVRLGRERFEATGVIAHKVHQGPVEVAAALAQAMRLKQDWLDDNGLTSTAFSDPSFRPMIEALARGDAPGVELVAMVLTIDGQPASIHWGFVGNQRYYLFMTARNQAYDAHAPGKLHIDYALKDCFALGLEVVDLLAPAVRYKLDWTKRIDEIQDYALPFTWRGRLVLDGWQRRLRPVAKRGFLRLPKTLRQGLARGLRR